MKNTLIFLMIFTGAKCEVTVQHCLKLEVIKNIYLIGSIPARFSKLEKHQVSASSSRM
ncbi:hypothetical protein EGK38_020000 [Enterobacter hormaechei]|nr:hypothetical protein EGK38_020000 [Enterobacter hormaechei]